MGVQIVERRSGKIPPCHISSELVRDLAQIINQSALKFMNQELAKLGPEPSEKDYSKFHRHRDQKRQLEQLKEITVTVESSQSTATYSSMNALEQLEIPDNLRKISIGASGYRINFSANAVFDLRYLDYSEYGAAGLDAQLVNGTVTTLKERLEKSKISRFHDFSQKDRYGILTSGALSFLIIWAMIKVLILAKVWNLRTDTMSVLTDSLVFTFIATFVGGWWMFGGVLRWLLPYFTYPGDRRNQGRSMVTAILYLIVAGLFINLLYDMIRVLLSS